MSGRRLDFQAIGTHWSVGVYDIVDESKWMSLSDDIFSRIDEFDKAYSRFRDDSLVLRMAKRAGTYELPEDGNTMLSFYELLYRVTAGKVTPLIGQTIADAGYDADYSFKKKIMQTSPRWEEVLSYDMHSITLKRPALLDFGAAGKGYLVDIVSGIISQAGIGSYLIDAGGDVLHRSKENELLEVGLENPADTSEAIGIVSIKNKSICASSGSKRSWGTFNHIIDPDELRSPDRVYASWVIADDTMTADGIATALFFTSPKALEQQFSFSCALLDPEMNLYHTKGFPIKTFVKQ